MHPANARSLPSYIPARHLGGICTAQGTKSRISGCGMGEMAMGCWLECERHGLGIRSDTDMKPWCLGGDATALSLLREKRGQRGCGRE